MEKICIAVPSYRRPTGSTVYKIDPRCTYDKYLCIRPEEIEDYQPIADKTGFKILLLEDVHDIGDTRQRMVEKLSTQYEWMFMLDDDLEYIEIVGKRDNNIAPVKSIVSGDTENLIIDKDALDMWFNLTKLHDSPYSSIRFIRFFRGKRRYSLINKRSIGAAMLLHLPTIMRIGNYRSVEEVGAEDKYMTYKIMSSGEKCAVFESIQFDSSRCGGNKGGCRENIYKKGMKCCYKQFFDKFLENVCNDTNQIKPYKTGGSLLVNFCWDYFKGSRTPSDIPEV